MGSIARVRVTWTGLAGLPGLTTLWFAVGTSTADTRDALVRSWLTAMKADMPSSLTATVQSEQALIESDTGQITSIVAGPGPGPISGTAATQVAPAPVQGMLKLNTATFVGGRRIQGRIYLPGVTINNAAYSPASVYMSRIQGFAETMRAAASTVGPWIVYSRPFAGSPGDPTATPPKPARPARVGSIGVISSVSVWDKWAVLRSRRD